MGMGFSSGTYSLECDDAAGRTGPPSEDLDSVVSVGASLSVAIRYLPRPGMYS